MLALSVRPFAAHTLSGLRGVIARGDVPAVDEDSYRMLGSPPQSRLLSCWSELAYQKHPCPPAQRIMTSTS